MCQNQFGSLRRSFEFIRSPTRRKVFSVLRCTGTRLLMSSFGRYRCKLYRGRCMWVGFDDGDRIYLLPLLTAELSRSYDESNAFPHRMAISASADPVILAPISLQRDRRFSCAWPFSRTSSYIFLMNNESVWAVDPSANKHRIESRMGLFIVEW